MRWVRALALALAVGSPGMLARPQLGDLVKVVATIDGPLRVFRDGAGCVVTWKGVVIDSVDLVTCAS